MRLIRSGVVCGLVLGGLVTTWTLPASAERTAAARIGRSIAATRDEGSARVEGSIKMKMGSDEFELTIAGVVGLGSRGDASLMMRGDIDAPFELEMRAVDGVAYLNLEGLRALGGDQYPAELSEKAWVRLDATGWADASQQGATLPGSSSNPGSQLDALRGIVKGSIETIGTETLDGVRTTHYRGIVDLRKATERVPRRFREQFSAAFEVLGPNADYAIDVWLDSHDRVRREVVDLRFTAQGESVLGSVRYDFLEFGIAVDVETPAPSEVMSFQRFQELMSSAGTSTV